MFVELSKLMTEFNSEKMFHTRFGFSEDAMIFSKVKIH